MAAASPALPCAKACPALLWSALVSSLLRQRPRPPPPPPAGSAASSLLPPHALLCCTACRTEASRQAEQLKAQQAGVDAEARRKAQVGGWGWAWSLPAQKLVSHHTLERGLLSTLPPLSSRLDLPLFTACLHTLPCNCSLLSAGGPRPGPPAAARPPSRRPGRAPQVRSWHACPALPAQPCLPALLCLPALRIHCAHSLPQPVGSSRPPACLSHTPACSTLPYRRFPAGLRFWRSPSASRSPPRA